MEESHTNEKCFAASGLANLIASKAGEEQNSVVVNLMGQEALCDMIKVIRQAEDDFEANPVRIN
jgi:hypothetical protein